MSPRFAGAFLVVAIMLLVLAGTPGCQTSPGSSEIERLSKGLDQLTAKVDKLSEQLVTKKDLDDSGKKCATKEELEGVRSGLGMAKADLATHMEAVAQLHFEQEQLAENVRRRFPAVEQELAKVKKDSGEHIQAVRESNETELASLGKRTAGIETRVLGIEGRLAIPSPQSPPRKLGILRIENIMSRGEYLLVNGAQYWISPSAPRDVDVPVGEVKTELPGYESPRYHWVGPPTYLQRIVIAPKGAQ
jgi:hypothetical protein